MGAAGEAILGAELLYTQRTLAVRTGMVRYSQHVSSQCNMYQDQKMVALTECRYLIFVVASLVKAFAVRDHTTALDFSSPLKGASDILHSLTMGRSLSTTSLVIIANTPQLLVSLAYILVNRLITAISVSREWASFGASRKSLRTTNPIAAQRSTYWLQIPYRFALPMIVASTALNYITSQVMYFAVIRVYANNVTAAL